MKTFCPKNDCKLYMEGFCMKQHKKFKFVFNKFGGRWPGSPPSTAPVVGYLGKNNECNKWYNDMLNIVMNHIKSGTKTKSSDALPCMKRHRPISNVNNGVQKKSNANPATWFFVNYSKTVNWQNYCWWTSKCNCRPSKFWKLEHECCKQNNIRNSLPIRGSRELPSSNLSPPMRKEHRTAPCLTIRMGRRSPTVQLDPDHPAAQLDWPTTSDLKQYF